MGRDRKRKFNFDEADIKIQDGEYDAIVRYVEERESKSSGADMYVWEFELPDIGETIQHFTVLTNAALWNLQRTLDAIGLQSVGEVDFDPDEAEGRALVVTIENQKYQGKPRATVVDLKRHPSGVWALREAEKNEPSSDDDDVPF